MIVKPENILRRIEWQYKFIDFFVAVGKRPSSSLYLYIIIAYIEMMDLGWDPREGLFSIFRVDC